jgi:RsmE family RNA methyltransferase
VEVLRVADANICLSYQESSLLAIEPWADLILALPRPAVLHRLLQMAAAMRISRLHLLRSWRVEKSFFSSPALRPEAIRQHLILGAEQGMVTRLPEVRIHHRLVPFIEEFASRTEPGHRILAHPGSERPLESVFAAGSDPGSLAPVRLAIGPEGGWIDREVESFSAIGFQPLSLGPWVLRVETAVAVALGQIEMARRRIRQSDES